MLEVRTLSVDYGGVPALKDLGFSLKKGEALGILGPNGAGKTSLLHAVAGLVSPTGGDILLDSVSVLSCPPEERVRRGMSLVPEGRRLFGEMTVWENLMVGAHLSPENAEERARILLRRFPVLWEKRRSAASGLSGGQQQLVAIARAVMGRARLLMLDEPTMGLSPQAAAEVEAFLRTLGEKGTTLLISGQNRRMIQTLCPRVLVLRLGEIAYTGATGRLGSLERLYL